MRNIFNIYGQRLLDTATKAGLDALKKACKKVVHKAAKAMVEFIGNKIADKNVKPKLSSDEKLRDVTEIFVPSEKREDILNELRQVL